ncbi:Hypothetical protein A7982_05991 [Minicystis rosea]|nr:Hypothetical protein A7982_05991 [Minicystis rosea]
MSSPFSIPEARALRELRRALARGGLPPRGERTPEDEARIASFRVMEELLRLLDHYRRRIESGERCRLVEHQHQVDPDRLHLEIEVES